MLSQLHIKKQFWNIYDCNSILCRSKMDSISSSYTVSNGTRVLKIGRIMAKISFSKCSVDTDNYFYYFEAPIGNVKYAIT